MSADLDTFLAELYRQGVENDERVDDRARKMLNLEPDTARLIDILIRSGDRRQVLEIGTSNGYSTIWLARAVGPEGRVLSVEVNPAKQDQAESNLRRAGLRERVDLVLGSAADVLPNLAGPFDLVFFDADRRSAAQQLQMVLPHMKPDVLLLHDNALSHPDEIADYLAAVDSLPDFDHVIVPVGKGLSLAYRGARNHGMHLAPLG